MNDDENCERCIGVNCNDKANGSAIGVLVNFTLVIAVVIFNVMLV
jgi:hypothetical protein